MAPDLSCLIYETVVPMNIYPLSHGFSFHPSLLCFLFYPLTTWEISKEGIDQGVAFSTYHTTQKNSHVFPYLEGKDRSIYIVSKQKANKKFKGSIKCPNTLHLCENTSPENIEQVGKDLAATLVCNGL